MTYVPPHRRDGDGFDGPAAAPNNFIRPGGYPNPSRGGVGGYGGYPPPRSPPQQPFAGYPPAGYGQAHPVPGGYGQQQNAPQFAMPPAGYGQGGGFAPRPGGFPGADMGGFGGFGHRSQGAYHRDPQMNMGPAHVREDRDISDLFKDHSVGINFDNYENIEVSLKPNNIPPAESFDEMNLTREVHENIRLCSYKKPTPVQKWGIPVVVAGNDLMACAQTGSGKTAAYLIPAVNSVVKGGTRCPPGRTAFPSSLIMAPTRELTIQIYDEGRKFTHRTGSRCVVVYGGADSRSQIYQLQRGCDILAATPGRLWEMHQRGVVKFENIKFLVLDEADRMLDMGFEPQIRTIVQSRESDMPPAGKRQTLMYSATFPREIQQLAREFLSQHYFLQVGRVGSTTENITQELRWVEDSEKRKALIDIIAQNAGQLILVFVERKRDADYLDRALNQLQISCTSIHGDRQQREREEALNLFKSGMCKVLVATDVAARGLDIPNVGIVLQFDLPTNFDDYVHRIGRTGRAGKTGNAIAFFNEKNRNVADELCPYLKEHRQAVPDWLDAMAVRRPQHNSRGRGARGGSSRGGGFFGMSGGMGGFSRGGAPPAPPNVYGGAGHHHSQQFYSHPHFNSGQRNLFQPRGGY